MAFINIFVFSSTTTLLFPWTAMVINATITQPERKPEYLPCLKHKDDIQKALTAVTPPFDNYYNISRAIYPSVHVPSLYVRIWIQFYNRSSPTSYNIVGRPEEFTWSKSCLYVGTRFINLYAMNTYSLLAVWPNRRQQDLKMTMLKFCKHFNTGERHDTTTYFLSTVCFLLILNIHCFSKY